MTISKNGLALIEGFEGYRARPYADLAGFLTVGFGHLIRRGEHFVDVTRQQAEQILAHDVMAAELAVNHGVKVPLTQNQFDALVSLTFNIGGGAFLRSTLLRFLNAGDYEGAAKQILVWNRAGGQVVHGLMLRRDAERKLFLTPDDSVTA